jgi:excisionase family DNA binding protein
MLSAAENRVIRDQVLRGGRVTLRAGALFSPTELAEYLNLPVKTIYTWRHTGHGPRGFRVGRHVRYREEDVQHWIAEQAAKEGGHGT